MYLSAYDFVRLPGLPLYDCSYDCVRVSWITSVGLFVRLCTCIWITSVQLCTCVLDHLSTTVCTTVYVCLDYLCTIVYECLDYPCTIVRIPT